MFSAKLKVLRKILIESSLKYSPQSEQIQSISRKVDSKPTTRKNSSPLRKQDKQLSQNNKKFSGGGFTLLLNE